MLQFDLYPFASAARDGGISSLTNATNMCIVAATLTLVFLLGPRILRISSRIGINATCVILDKLSKGKRYEVVIKIMKFKVKVRTSRARLRAMGEDVPPPARNVRARTRNPRCPLPLQVIIYTHICLVPIPGFALFDVLIGMVSFPVVIITSPHVSMMRMPWCGHAIIAAEILFSLLCGLPVSRSAIDQLFALVKTGGLTEEEAVEYYKLFYNELPDEDRAYFDAKVKEGKSYVEAIQSLFGEQTVTCVPSSCLVPSYPSTTFPLSLPGHRMHTVNKALEKKGERSVRQMGDAKKDHKTAKKALIFYSESQGQKGELGDRGRTPHSRVSRMA